MMLIHDHKNVMDFLKRCTRLRRLESHKELRLLDFPLNRVILLINVIKFLDDIPCNRVYSVRQILNVLPITGLPP